MVEERVAAAATEAFCKKPYKLIEAAAGAVIDAILARFPRVTRVRVTVQLIDAAADQHLWAERYDRDLQDIFAIQDEITSTIVATIPGRLEAATQERAKRKPVDNLAAYECVLAGKILHHRSTREDNLQALRMLDRATELDSNYAHAHAWRACVLGQSWVNGWATDRSATWNAMIDELKAAVATIDDDELEDLAN